MKPRIGVYLSKRTATRLTTVAKRKGATKSALVEAALDRFLGAEDTSNAATVTDCLGELRGQIDQLDRDLGIVSEIVSLHARFHLAVTPDASTARKSCVPKFDGGRTDESSPHDKRGSPLTQEASDGLGITSQNVLAVDPGEGASLGPASLGCEPGFRSSRRVDQTVNVAAAVREDGSTSSFQARPRNPLH